MASALMVEPSANSSKLSYTTVTFVSDKKKLYFSQFTFLTEFAFPKKIQFFIEILLLKYFVSEFTFWVLSVFILKISFLSILFVFFLIKFLKSKL